MGLFFIFFILGLSEGEKEEKEDGPLKAVFIYNRTHPYLITDDQLKGSVKSEQHSVRKQRHEERELTVVSTSCRQQGPL